MEKKDERRGQKRITPFILAEAVIITLAKKWIEGRKTGHQKAKRVGAVSLATISAATAGYLTAKVQVGHQETERAAYVEKMEQARKEFLETLEVDGEEFQVEIPDINEKLIVEDENGLSIDEAVEHEICTTNVTVPSFELVDDSVEPIEERPFYVDEDGYVDPDRLIPPKNMRKEIFDTYCNDIKIYRERGMGINYYTVKRVLDDFERERGFKITPEHFIATLIVETRGNSNAVSESGASGLMQVMPSSARELMPDDKFKEMFGKGKAEMTNNEIGQALLGNKNVYRAMWCGAEVMLGKHEATERYNSKHPNNPLISDSKEASNRYIGYINTAVTRDYISKVGAMTAALGGEPALEVYAMVEAAEDLNMG